MYQWRHRCCAIKIKIGQEFFTEKQHPLLSFVLSASGTRRTRRTECSDQIQKTPKSKIKISKTLPTLPMYLNKNHPLEWQWQSETFKVLFKKSKVLDLYATCDRSKSRTTVICFIFYRSVWFAIKSDCECDVGPCSRSQQSTEILSYRGDFVNHSFVKVCH